ncbi:MAG: hypothetical protein IPL06_01020 [Betaproteobacteria bacterium]|nr:hypothetical protein [Betaproteobacteria bacterium]
MNESVRSLLRVIMAALALASSPPAASADPTAFVCDVKGEVALNDGGRPPFLGELIPGSRLKLGPGAQAAVMFVVSGEEFILKGPGEFVVGKDSVTAATGATPAKRRLASHADAMVIVQASKAGTASLRMRSAQVPKPGAVGPQFPTGSIAQLQPALRWGGDPSATYEIVVTAASGKQVHAGTVRGTTLKLPVKLVAGQSYSWSVTPKEGPPADARFEVLSADAVQKADKARASARSFSDRVQLALVLQGIGAAPDAREVWGQLAAERPDIPELPGLARP